MKHAKPRHNVLVNIVVAPVCMLLGFGITTAITSFVSYFYVPAVYVSGASDSGERVDTQQIHYRQSFD